MVTGRSDSSAKPCLGLDCQMGALQASDDERPQENGRKERQYVVCDK